MRSGKRFIPLVFIQLWLVAVLTGCGGGGTMDEAAMALSRGETAKAIEIYKYQAEEKNNSMAMRQLGIIYMSGQGVPKDYAAAEVWFQEGVKAGDGMSGTLLESLRAMRAAESGGSAPQASSEGGGSKAAECGRKKSNCRTACSAAPSAYGYGTSSRSGCYAGCDGKYNKCME
jgi:TPR repeat protein